MEQFSFCPDIARWFEEKFHSPTPSQALGWPAVQSGAHTLIAAPTGSGKTLAAFLASLDSLFRQGLAGNLPEETQVVYVSPLKALGNDIHKNLEVPLAEIRAAILASHGIDIHVRAEVRSGDTPAAKRAAIAKHPPHILVTTPESFYLLLTSASGRRMLTSVRMLIVDEIHAVVGNRRGSHLALSMERLSALAHHPVQRVGVSATQRPIEEVARFIVGSRPGDDGRPPRCRVVDTGHSRPMDLALELPGSPLEAVMSNEVWAEVHRRLLELIQAHRTTLIFVNTRRLAERVAHQLGSLLGEDKVMSHHGSLSTRLRLDAENRLKRGELQTLVATSSLELGIDIGSIDLVCQLGSTRSIAALLQRVGRAGHQREGLPKGRLFPLTRDELVECTAMLASVRRGELDRVRIPSKPLDVLAQQIVAAASSEDWAEEELFELVRRAYPYRNLARHEFDEVIRMLAEGFSTKRGRRAALIHHDAVNHRVRGRRGSRIVALTSGGAIPDTGDYRVVLEPGETFIGTVNEDFAVESLAGDIFQLGNASWKILRVDASTVRVEDAHGQPPGIPFWLGEGLARTPELSHAVSALREAVSHRIDAGADREALVPWFMEDYNSSEAAARQLTEYFMASHTALGALPSQGTLVMERFFDESGGMQLVIHSLFGARINRAWGLALRKRFCRAFNFELQAAATDDAMVLSLGTQHSFPLEEVFHYLHSKTVREVLVQALLDAPMFAIRWRWNATRSLALPRQRAGRKIPAPLQRMESENLLAAVFPDQLACLENIAGDREVPDHPLVRQTIEDCLVEAMDIEGLEALLRRIEAGEIQCVARDLPEPSPLAHEILNARPYAFLDNAPLEERRTRAVYTRRATEPSAGGALGILDSAAIERVCDEAWPLATNADEFHDALLQLGVMTQEDALRCTPDAAALLGILAADHRAGRMTDGRGFWVAAERLSWIHLVYGASPMKPELAFLPSSREGWERDDALRELVRGRMEVSGPMTARRIAEILQVETADVDRALIALETEGCVLRGRFRPESQETEWCDRRLLARIHRLTLHRLRAEIRPVSLADFQRFLLAWQRVDAEHRAEGPEGVAAVLELLDGFELPAAAWEPNVLASRVKDYSPQWLDRLCSTGRIGWGRLAPPPNASARLSNSLRSTPIALFRRDHLSDWVELTADPQPELSSDAQIVFETLQKSGALFFGEIVERTHLLPSRVEQALGELVAQGCATADSFEGLRALLVPAERRESFSQSNHPRHHRAVTSIEFAGRWSLIARKGVPGNGDDAQARERAITMLANALLRRYGVMFRRLLDREALQVSWYELGRIYRRLEAQGHIRGGHFVSGVSGEQFALPEAIGLLRSVRKTKASGDLVVLSAADPLNLVGILAPGPRVAAIAPNRVLFQDGIVLGSREGGKVLPREEKGRATELAIEDALTVGRLPTALRPYYR